MDRPRLPEGYPEELQDYLNPGLGYCDKGGVYVLFRVCALAISLSLPIVSVGIGNGGLECFLLSLSPALILYGVDPSPNKGFAEMPAEVYRRLGLKPIAATVAKLLGQKPELVGNCLLLLNWCEPMIPESGPYDLEAIKLLKPRVFVTVIERIGAAGSFAFLAFLTNSCGLFCTEPREPGKLLYKVVDCYTKEVHCLTEELQQKRERMRKTMQMQLQMFQMMGLPNQLTMSDVDAAIAKDKIIGVSVYSIATLVRADTVPLPNFSGFFNNSLQEETQFAVFEPCRECGSTHEHLSTDCSSQVRPKKIVSFKPCAYCGNTKTKKKLCGRCKTIGYCSAACQKADWKKHRDVCAEK